jgi:hypothetical protein
VDTRGIREVHTEFCFGNLKERGLLEGLGLSERIMLKCAEMKWDGIGGLDSSGRRYRTVPDPGKDGNFTTNLLNTPNMFAHFAIYLL